LNALMQTVEGVRFEMRALRGAVLSGTGASELATYPTIAEE
jgi:hypothetical protein